MRLFGIFIGTFLAALAATLLLPVSPYYLPRTGCRPSEQSFAALKMQTKYAEAAKMFGCEGILIGTVDYGELKILTYGWRGAGSPYEVFRLSFYNDTLQKTERRSFTFKR